MSIASQASAGHAVNTACFSAASISRLSGIMTEERVEPGSCLFVEGDLADKLYWIQAGKVKCTKANEEGKSFLMHLYRDGDLMGQFDPYADSRHNMTALAVTPCTVGVMERGKLEPLLLQYGELAVEFMKWIGLAHRAMQNKFRDLMLYGKPGALCSTLIRLANTLGAVTPDGILLTEKWTNAELADTIGAARESVNRLLGEWKQQGAIEYRDGFLLITDLAFLQKLCHCEQCPRELCRM